MWIELHGVGAGRRPSTCPQCGSSDRERLVYLYLKDYFLPKQKKEHIKCLHIAPERQLSFFLSRQTNIEYNASDKRAEGYYYPDNVQDIDIMSMPEIPDNTYDLVICNHVLEHVPNDITAMKELRRIIKYKGTAILQVPYALKLQKTIDNPTITTPEARFKAYGQNDHVRLYGMDYPKRLKEAGFYVDIENITKKYSKKRGLNKDENIFICHKL